MADTTETFQIPLEAAEMYESHFVPRLFARWAARLVDVAGVGEGQRVLDVACGTGAVARAAEERTDQVTGLDVNEAMLTVARRLRPNLQWRRGDAGELPFPAASFDVVLCQAALMFFPDPERALREMGRVLAPSGTVGVQVWDRREDQPAYRPFIEVVGRHAGPEAVNLIAAYFVRGDLAELTAMLASARLEVTGTRTESTSMRFSSVDELVATEVQSTPLGERLDEDVIRRIIEGSRDALRSFQTEQGELDIPIGGHIVTARKR
jgi:ubiquinone/menaquinone biosynthesis C-methylase UbiE